MTKINNTQFLIRNIPPDQKKKLEELQVKNNYSSLNQFLLDQLSLICQNATIDEYDSHFGKNMERVIENQLQLIRLYEHDQKERLKLVQDINDISSGLNNLTAILFQTLGVDVDSDD